MYNVVGGEESGCLSCILYKCAHLQACKCSPYERTFDPQSSPYHRPRCPLNVIIIYNDNSNKTFIFY